MPRPSLKSERSEEILAAYTRCIARYGLEGATQDRIAAEAGVKRPLLRHYLGNRDAMIAALIDHMEAVFDGQTEALLAALPERNRIEALLDLLFAREAATDAETILAFQALANASDRTPGAQDALLGAVSRFLAALEGELAAAFPEADAERVAAAAMGLMGIYFNTDSLAPLQLPKAWRATSRRAAEILIESLGDERDI